MEKIKNVSNVSRETKEIVKVSKEDTRAINKFIRYINLSNINLTQKMRKILEIARKEVDEGTDEMKIIPIMLEGWRLSDNIEVESTRNKLKAFFNTLKSVEVFTEFVESEVKFTFNDLLAGARLAKKQVKRKVAGIPAKVKPATPKVGNKVFKSGEQGTHSTVNNANKSTVAKWLKKPLNDRVGLIKAQLSILENKIEKLDIPHQVIVYEELKKLLNAMEVTQ